MYSRDNKLQIKNQLSYERKKYQHEQQQACLMTPLGRSVNCLTTTQKITLALALTVVVAPIVYRNIKVFKFDQVANSTTTPATAHDSNAITDESALKNQAYALWPANQASAKKENHTPSLNYKGVPIKDISQSKNNCATKVIGHSSGKICVIDTKKYYMKVFDDEYQNALLGIFNLQFMRDNVGIVTPEATILSDKGIFYFATEEIENFVSATTFTTKTHHSFFNDAVQIRALIVDKIGETGISKFMVATTFIDDLKPENWGYNDKGLVLIDLDIAPRRLLSFFARSPQILQHGITLTLRNVQEMQQIYQSMLEKPLPTVDLTVDLTQKIYTTVLNVYIQACQDLIDNFSITFPSCTENTASMHINQELVNNIERLGKQVSLLPRFRH